MPAMTEICSAGPIPADYDILTMGCPRPPVSQIEGWILLVLLIFSAIATVAHLYQADES